MAVKKLKLFYLQLRGSKQEEPQEHPVSRETKNRNRKKHFYCCLRCMMFTNKSSTLMGQISTVSHK